MKKQNLLFLVIGSVILFAFHLLWIGEGIRFSATWFILMVIPSGLLDAQL